MTSLLSLTLPLLLLSFGCNAGQVGDSRPLSPEQLQSREFLDAVKEATIEMNARSNSARFQAVSGIRSATQQVVSGILYEFSAAFANTNCENRPELLLENAEQCKASDNEDVKFLCEFRVLYRPWVGGPAYKVDDNFHCSVENSKRPKRQLGGGGVGSQKPVSPQETERPAFQGALKAAQVDFNRNSQLASLHLLLRHSHATKQIVSGILYRFDAEFVESSCENTPENHEKGLEDCRPSNSAASYTCPYSVVYQAWMPVKYRIVSRGECSVGRA